MTTQFITDLVAQHLYLAYALIFLVSLGEALFVIGLVMPSTVVLVGAGALAGAGKIDLWTTLALGSLGAAAGDAISYWVGRRYGEAIRGVWPFRNYTALLDKGEAYFEKHGGKSVFLCRFLPGVKSIVPGIAGMAGMRFGWFTVVNVVSAVAWAGAHILPAAGIGLALGRVHGFDPRLAILGGVVVALVVLAWYALKLAFLVVLPPLAQWHGRRVAVLEGRTSPLGRIERSILLNRGNVAGAALVLSIAALGLVGFIVLAGNLLFEPELAAADTAFYNLLQSFRTPWGTSAMTAVTMTADVPVLGALSLALLGWLAFKRHWRIALASLAAMATSLLFVPVVKSAIGRARPNTLYSGADAFSFPSGHATLAMTVFGVIAVLFALRARPARRPLVLGLAVIAALAVAFSRLYLGAHWLSDVAAGLSIGFMVALVLMFVLERWHAARMEAVDMRSLAVILAVTFSATYAVHLYRDHARWTAEYAVDDRTTVLTASEWRAGGSDAIPSVRVALDGETGGALAFQTDLGADALTAELASIGWMPLAAGSALDAIFPSRIPFADRPALPLLQNGRRTALAFTPTPEAAAKLPDPPKGDEGEATDDARWVLRFWPTQAVIDTVPPRPVLVGALTAEYDELLAGGYATADPIDDGPAIARGTDALRMTLASASVPTIEAGGATLLTAR